MRILLPLLFLFIYSPAAIAQLSGTITSTEQNSLPFVNIYLENTQLGTSSNADGNYQLNINQPGTYKVTFQSLGYATKRVEITIDTLPYRLDIQLADEATSLDEVVVDASVNPAERIVRETIANRETVRKKLTAYKADFYSRGLWKVENAPERILGQEVDLGSGLDSTRSGIVYLSETISNISFKAPDDFKEVITASKVSGDDQGFSFNSAREADFSFYDNTLEIEASVVSPLASDAFSYYNYNLAGSFYEGSYLVNKIEVQPKRKNDRVFSGFIYIVEDLWQLYGVDLSTTGAAIQVPFVEELQFQHDFKFVEEQALWVKISQTIDFSFKLFGFGGNGRFTAVYSNYDFNPDFNKQSFTNEVLSFEEDANKQDSVYWNKVRPVPLTPEEQNDYKVKDSIQLVERSESYLDSVDVVGNAFRLTDFVTGYSYTNTYDRWRFNIDSPLPGIRFNTIQGWNTEMGLGYASWSENYNSAFNANVTASYGLSDEKMRFMGSLAKRFNQTNRRTLWLRAGRRVQQFNAEEPISAFINSIATLFWERNYLKAYDLNLIQAGYSEEVFNGVQVRTNLSYEKRSPLFNNTDYVLIKNDVNYTSNNPLAPDDFENAAITEHEIAKFNLSARIHFDQKYQSYPDRKFNLNTSRYPSLRLEIEQGFAASQSAFNYTQLRGAFTQQLDAGNKGNFQYHLGGGIFLNADEISFVDYQHFNGNQTRVNTTDQLQSFNLLPYYQLSTNKNYAEAHVEHNFRGYLLGKVPGLRALNLNLIAGAKALSITGSKPYTEVSVGVGNLGIGKLKFLRVDYVRSFYNGNNDGAFVFGLSF